MNPLQDFKSILNTSLTLESMILNIIVALICGITITFFYRISYRGLNYSATFVNALVILSMITSIVIMIIGNNLARAFGLVGAMSIIRFRTAVKDSQDIVFIFFALAIGMASGIGFYGLAIIGTLFVGTTIYVLYKTDYATIKKREFLLQFSYKPGDETEPPYMSLLKSYCNEYRLINIKSYEDGSLLEPSFYVNLKDRDKSSNFVKEVSKTEGISNVNLFFDEEYI